ncbi:RUS1 family protein C16orf58 homolog isoform X1 [Mobula hypostoma]|uniref:RUS1 family protein C16orf58 homolog isoform X1 n=2 Tax=Mobula hypostoma TaxID=723540 RepID=UPI002FC33492
MDGGDGRTMPRMDRAIFCSEKYGGGGAHHYIHDLEGRLLRKQEKTGQVANSLARGISSVFLPQGYPESVSADYLSYQVWDTVQAFASTLTGTLATQAVLRGVGVGDSSATVAAASLTWMLKDGTGMIGRILFAWLKGTQLDQDAKQWRLFADLLNDLAIFIEITAPAFPTIFTLIICVSCLLKSVVGVAGGATRAALTVHQARRDNMADVSAKDGSQETLVNLAGLSAGALLAPLTADNLLLTHLLFALFTILHLFANYRAVRAVVMETLNNARLRLLLDTFLREGVVPLPASINPREPLLPAFWRRGTVRLGAPLHTICQSVAEYQRAIENNSKNYLLGIHRDTGEVSICLREGAGSVDIIQAAIHAELLLLLLHRDLTGFRVEHRKLAELQASIRTAQDERLWDVVSATHLLVDQLFPGLVSGARSSGWLTERHQLGPDEWRARWGPGDKKDQ